MPRVLVDEDLPRSLVRVLCEAGIEAEDVRDVGLRGRPDAVVLEHAGKNGQVLVTGDLGFGNLLRFPLGSHAGILVAHFPNEMPSGRVAEAVLTALQRLTDDDLRGNLAVLSPGKLRLRRV